jgi:hypothetical protein
MYVNGKIRPVETIPEMQGNGIKNDGMVNSSRIFLIYCKNFCKCHNGHPPSITIKTENRKVKQVCLGAGTSGRGEDMRKGCRR